MRADRDHLDREQALRLLAGMTTGRVVYTAEALPAVLPVRFRFAADGSLLLDTRAPSDLLRAADSGVIAFETGEIDSADGRGWSVTVVGRANVITGLDGNGGAVGGEIAVSAAAEPPSPTVIRLRPELVTGRRLGEPPYPSLIQRLIDLSRCRSGQSE
ncbi:pyridoxamine 5'-phosphate oxidase family protein [Streptomyces sp. HUAS TT7]|uniref:pyridoxamine 5'-phosphate oxidase family protein n=1 Tax=Streptomyces sp. HUAS TT7 TaxID=3447507 RepID=UPI003F65DB0A